MEIVIGGIPPLEASGKTPPAASSSPVEARILDVRSPRKQNGEPPLGQAERRTGKGASDPANARIMTILIPEGQKIPKDIASGNYRLFIRFVRRAS
jgi:hypothetical protein